jgi:hypothetical protein
MSLGNSPTPDRAQQVVSIIGPRTPAQAGGTAFWQEQLAFVDSYSDLREDRAAEILSQMAAPFAYWGSINYLHPDRTKWTLELLKRLSDSLGTQR